LSTLFEKRVGDQAASGHIAIKPLWKEIYTKSLPEMKGV
jgi:hypothetical protein